MSAVLEVQALVRVLFADHGSREDPLTTLHQFSEHDRRRVRSSARGPFPEHLHLNALIFEFTWRYTEALREWADWAIEEVGR